MLVSALAAGLAAQATRSTPAGPAAPAAQPALSISRGSFSFSADARGVSMLANPADPFGAVLTTPASAGRNGRGAAPAATLALTVTYRIGQGEWTAAEPRAVMTALPAGSGVAYSTAAGAPLAITESYRTDGASLDWTIDLEAVKGPVTIGDLGIGIPLQGPTGENPQQIFERGFPKHQFVSGAGSFAYFVRASGAPPFLLVTVRPGTKLEYAGTPPAAGAAQTGRGGGAQLWVHSARAAAAESRGTWRQPNTTLELPAGRKASYGFRLQWASSYEDLRRRIFDAGLFDVRVAPGMTVPIDLGARIALHTKAKIDAVTAEFPAQTTIAASAAATPLADTTVYDVAFTWLGENMLTITHDGGRKTYLEFFVTEPLFETVIKKRAAFLSRRPAADQGSARSGGTASTASTTCRPERYARSTIPTSSWIEWSTRSPATIPGCRRRPSSPRRTSASPAIRN